MVSFTLVTLQMPNSSWLINRVQSCPSRRTWLKKRLHKSSKRKTMMRRWRCKEKLQQSNLHLAPVERPLPPNPTGSPFRIVLTSHDTSVSSFLSSIYHTYDSLLSNLLLSPTLSIINRYCYWMVSNRLVTSIDTKRQCCRINPKWNLFTNGDDEMLLLAMRKHAEMGTDAILVVWLCIFTVS